MMELLMKNYKPSEIHHLTKAGKMSGSEIQGFVERYRCLFGHFRFHPELVRPENFLFAFLRDPVDRCISNFFHLIREQRYTDLKAMEAMEFYLSEEELIKTGNWNRQTHFLAGTKGRKFFKNEEKYHVNLAIERLEQLSFIGITEHFEESVFMLGQSLGWKKWYYLPQNTNRRPELKNKLLNQFGKQLQEANEWDQQVYEAGLKIFEKQRSHIHVPFHKKAVARMLSTTKKLMR